MIIQSGKHLNFFADVNSLSRLVIHWKKKWSHFDLKSWVTGGTKIRPGIPSNRRMIESNWLDIESQILNWLSISNQFDSNILQLLGIPGRILVPPVTQLFRSKWLNFFFQCWWTKIDCFTQCRQNFLSWLTLKTVQLNKFLYLFSLM